MEPVTHFLTGACLGRSGFNRKAAYATAAMAIAAEFPDIDTLWSLRGPVEGFQHHRGITHTFAGIPFEAAFLVFCFWALHRWRLRRPNTTQPITKAPVRWATLYGLVVLALLSHIFLDYTNNYGVRPFFPFDPHWYAGSFVFIFDPLLFLILLGALTLPALFRLIKHEIGDRRHVFHGRKFALGALLCIAAYYGLRASQHARAVNIAMSQTYEDRPEPKAIEVLTTPDAPRPPDPLPQTLTAQRVLANPDPISPFRWHTVTDYGPLYHLDAVDTWRGFFEPGDNLGGLERKLDANAPVLQAAFRSPLGRAYLDWSSMPWIDLSLPTGDQPKQPSIVFFRDPRFMGDVPLLHSSDRVPITATVELNAENKVTAQTMDGKVE